MLERVGHRTCGWRRGGEGADSTGQPQGEANLPLFFQISSKSADGDAHAASLLGLIISLHLVKNVSCWNFV